MKIFKQNRLHQRATVVYHIFSDQFVRTLVHQDKEYDYKHLPKRKIVDSWRSEVNLKKWIKKDELYTKLTEIYRHDL